MLLPLFVKTYVIKTSLINYILFFLKNKYIIIDYRLKKYFIAKLIKIS
jgi:hypothetical protein